MQFLYYFYQHYGFRETAPSRGRHGVVTVWALLIQGVFYHPNLGNHELCKEWRDGLGPQNTIPCPRNNKFMNSMSFVTSWNHIRRSFCDNPAWCFWPPCPIYWDYSSVVIKLIWYMRNLMVVHNHANLLQIWPITGWMDGDTPLNKVMWWQSK